MKAITERQAVLFDLDGTLTDPAEGITRSVQEALRQMGRPVPEQDKLLSFIGPPLLDSFQEYCGMEREEAEKAIRLYRGYFSRQGIWENRVYPGIPELQRIQKEQGRQVILATSKPAVFASQILERFKLAPYVSLTAGSELDGTRSRKDEVIAWAMERAGLSPEEAVMVGDREYDVRGAAACGLPCIGVLYGYGSRAELERAGAALVVPTVEALTALWKEWR